MSEQQGTDVDVDWPVARDANRANWDERAALHEGAYGIDRYAEDPAYLATMVSDDLPVLAAHLPQGSLRGLDVVHLQCYIGTDTISLARAGGRMTGVDLSPSSLAAARRLAATTGSHGGAAIAWWSSRRSATPGPRTSVTWCPARLRWWRAGPDAPVGPTPRHRVSLLRVDEQRAHPIAPGKVRVGGRVGRRRP